jgi:hypothetical protein
VSGTRVVERLERDDLVARFEQREHRRGDRLGGSGGDQYLGVGVEVEPVEALLVRGDGGAQLRDPGARRVLVAAAVAQGADRGLAHRLGPVRVGEALPEVDRAGRGGQRGHLREDRGAESLEIPVEHRPAPGFRVRGPHPTPPASVDVTRARVALRLRLSEGYETT